MPTLILIDGSNQAFRAYYAIRADLRSPDGQPTRALYGFSRMLQAVLKEHQPAYMAAVFDVGPSFRNELYPDYKGQRPDKPADLAQQWPELMPLCEQFGVKGLGIQGFEADDIIGTLAVQAAASGFDVRIISSDKDFAQLVTDRIQLLDPKKGLADVAAVQKKWGVPPEKIIELMALMGDTSDNVPGVAGIGPKKAATFINKFGTAQGAVDAARGKQVGGKTGATLAAAEDVVKLSRTLVTIRTDLQLDVGLDDLAVRPWEPAPLRALLSRMGFFGMITELGLPAERGASQVSRDNYQLVDTPETLAALVAGLRAAGRFAFDCETTSLDPMSAKLVGMSFCWSEDGAYYVPIGHTQGGNCPGALEAILPILADGSIKKTGQNLKYDLKVLLANGHALAGIDGDTMLLDYLQHVDQKHNLDNLAIRHLSHEMIAYADVAGGSNFSEVSVADALLYAAEDAHVAWLLDQKLALEGTLKTLYDEVEVPLIPILAEMELAGIGVDVPTLHRISAELGRRIEQMVKSIHTEAGEVFNVNSTQQLATILFEKRGHKPVKKTKKGYSTDARTLSVLMDASDDKLLPMIVSYRELAKLKSTYVDALPDTVATDGRIHTSFHQAMAATGRLSSFSPNLQNIPIRTEEGRRIRACFVSKPGHRFLSADYSQVELRVLAHFCEDGPLVEAFTNGEDIHRRTASEIFGVSPEAVTADQRRAAKAINFGIIYGMSAFRLSRELKIPRSEAQQYIDNYFARYPQVRKYMDDRIEEARESGMVKTLFGRCRPVPDLTAKNKARRSAGERVAMNTPVQGTAADLMKMAMISVYGRLKREFPATTLLLQVHDELVVEVPEAQVDAVAAALREEMERVAQLHVPLKVETGSAETWDAAH
jgi:DNA polymerase-1